MKILKPYMQQEDDRGRMLGITNQGSWQEYNWLETKAGVVRGGHYHRETQELFFILEGDIEVVVQDLSGRETQRATLHGGDICLIEPLEVHSFHCLTACRWINALSRRMDPTAPDIHRPQT